MHLEVYLNAWGERRFVGLLEERGGDILFEYDRRFLNSGIELSPFLLPLRPGVASDPKRTFDELFGVFNDSLPDAGGCSCWTTCGLLQASHRYASLDYENLFRLGKSLTRNPEDVGALPTILAEVSG